MIQVEALSNILDTEAVFSQFKFLLFNSYSCPTFNKKLNTVYELNKKKLNRENAA